jgi:uncharacterized RDD family membrane protein YckC
VSYAGFLRRFLAVLLDGMLLGAIGGVLFKIFGLSFVDFAVAGENASTWQAVNTAVGLAYFVYFEGGRGATPGKSALGIRVVSANGGGPIGYGAAAVRYVGRIVSGIPLLLGYFWHLWDGKKQTWHDKFATSVVIRTS